MFALPFILLMSVTGLVILYSDPIQDVTQGDVLSGASTGSCAEDSRRSMPNGN
jgi:hypothetical protein